MMQIHMQNQSIRPGAHLQGRLVCAWILERAIIQPEGEVESGMHEQFTVVVTYHMSLYLPLNQQIGGGRRQALRSITGTVTGRRVVALRGGCGWAHNLTKQRAGAFYVGVVLYFLLSPTDGVRQARSIAGFHSHEAS